MANQKKTVTIRVHNDDGEDQVVQMETYSLMCSMLTEGGVQNMALLARDGWGGFDIHEQVVAMFAAHIGSIVEMTNGRTALEMLKEATAMGLAGLQAVESYRGDDPDGLGAHFDKIAAKQREARDEPN